MRLLRVLGICGVVISGFLVHFQTMLSRSRGYRSPCATFRAEDTYMPGGSVSIHIRHVVAHCSHACTT